MNDDGRQPIAIGHLSYSGDLKIWYQKFDFSYQKIICDITTYFVISQIIFSYHKKNLNFWYQKIPQKYFNGTSYDLLSSMYDRVLSAYNLVSHIYNIKHIF